MSPPWGYAFLAGCLLLSGSARTVPRHRSRRCRSVKAKPIAVLPLLAGAAVLALPALWPNLFGMLCAPPAAVAAILVSRRITASQRARFDERGVAFVLDLLAAVLAAGAAPATAIENVARACGDFGDEATRAASAPLELVGRLLQLGTDPERAWSVLDSVPALAPVAAAGRRCAFSGARLSAALADTAQRLREQQRQAALLRAQRAGVWTLLPLGFCFLPAFVCLGVVPVVVGVGAQVLPH